MKRKMLIAALLAALGFVSSNSASADQVYLKNGDRLDGKVAMVHDGKLMLTTPYAGDIKIDMAEVASFSTDAPVELKLANGDTLSRRVVADTGGQIALQGGMLQNEQIPLSSLATVNEPPQGIWTGDLSIGALLLRGNTQSDSINLAANLDRKTDHDELAFNGAYFYGRTKDRATSISTTTADNWILGLKYNYDFTKHFYGFVGALASKDRIASMDLRFTPSIGVGYKFIDKPDLTLAGEAGMAWVYEKYTNATPTREDVSVILAYHVVKKFNDSVSLMHNLTYLPSIQNSRNFIVSTDVGLRAKMTTHFFTEFKMALDYDSTPANGSLKNSTRYQLNLGYTL